MNMHLDLCLTSKPVLEEPVPLERSGTNIHFPLHREFSLSRFKIATGFDSLIAILTITKPLLMQLSASLARRQQGQVLLSNAMVF